MTLASTIEVNTGTLSPTGIVIAVLPGSDPSVPVELWRAPDSAGAPDVANAVMILAEVIKPGGINYVDSLPTDGVIYWYRSRTNGNAYGPGAYSDWVNLGAADRIMAEAVVALGASDASKNSAAWAQQNARIGPQTQNILPNSGWEDGLAFWFQQLGTMTAVNVAAEANGGNWYLKLTSTTGVAAQVTAGDDVGKTRYFEVNTGDLIQWGGWAYRVSGTANVRYVLEATDKDKATPVLTNTPNQNTAAWVFVQGQYVVPAGKKFVRVWAEIDATGTGVVARFDDAYLRIGLGALYDVPAPNSLYAIRFSAGVADPDGADMMQSYIDFPATTNFMRIGQAPLVIDGQSNASPIVITTHINHGYQTGDVVTIRGCTPNTAANGTWTITIDPADAKKFSLTTPTSTGNGATSATGHVVKLSMTIDPLGNLTVYAIIKAVAMTVLGLATFLGSVIMNSTLRVAGLQQPVGTVYNDTATNRILLEGLGDIKVIGDAQPSGGTNNETVRLGTYTVPLGTLTARTTLNQGTGAHYGWNDPDGGADGINSISLGATDNQTFGAAGRLYNTTGDATAGTNLPAYDNNYVVKFTLSATATGLAGIHYQTVDAQCTLEFSINGGSSYTAVGGTSSVSASASGSGSNTVSQTFTVTVNCPGAPGTGFRIRLILKGISGGNGAGGGVSVYVYNATNWSTDPWPVTWQSTSGATKTRRGAVLRATSDGTDQQPHAYLEPITALTPDANAAEGEVEYAGDPNHSLYVRDADRFCALPRVIYRNANLTGSNTAADTSLASTTLKANVLGSNARALVIELHGQIAGGTNATLKIKLGGATYMTHTIATATGTLWFVRCTITRTTGAAVQVANTIKSLGNNNAGVNMFHERVAGTVDLSADRTLDFTNISVGACTITVDTVQVMVL